MAQHVMQIRRSFKPVPVARLIEDQRVILARAAAEYEKKAREYAAERVPGSLAPGVVTRKLVNAIRYDKRDLGHGRTGKAGPSASGLTMGFTIRVHEEETIAERDDAGSSYAIFQEKGTGIWGSKGGWIKPKKFRYMKWPQKNYAYRGRFVQAKLMRYKLAPMKHANPKLAHALGVRATAKQRRVDREYDQYAQLVRGVHAKHYMQRSSEDPIIDANLHRELDRLMQRTMLNLTGLSPELMTGNPNITPRVKPGGFPWAE